MGNMRPLKCIFGFHDYEIISKKDDAALRDEATSKKKGRPSIGLEYITDRIYYKKVCLRCDHFLDEITPAKKIIEKQFIDKVSRSLQGRIIVDKLKREGIIQEE